MEFQLTSYESHRRIVHDSELVATWRNEKTVDFWRHERMYRQLSALLTANPKSKWLTVGDGRYGTDAHYIGKLGADAIASDINETYLKKAKEDGYITDYKVENAEALSFPDHRFDFVLCKESYHHFPRPMIALYEMLRVADLGVILIEPNDQAVTEPYRIGVASSAYWCLFSLKQWLKKPFGKPHATFPNRYEPHGNYVYSISRREIEKTALGLNLDAIAVKGMNDFYIEGVEYEEVADNGPLFRKIKKQIEELVKNCSRRPEQFGLLVAILFKRLPSAACLELMRQNQFDVKILEKNPYIKS